MKQKTNHYFSKQLFLVVSIALAFTFQSCQNKDDNYVTISPVVVDLTQVPYQNLSEYHFFDGDMKLQNPVYGVIPYKPTSSLFSDYALKKRFIWLPNNTKATYNSDFEILDLPVGAALVKTFYYDHVQPSNATQIIETRVLIKKATGWIVAEYVWNDEQTEATLQLSGSTKTISWMDNTNTIKTADYKIPSEANCYICHNVNNVTLPIGIKPQSLNSNYVYSEGSKNQLSKLISIGYLENNLPQTIVSVVDYEDTAQPLNLRMRSYFDVNCAHCHQDGGYGSFYVMRFAFNKTTNPVNLGICMTANHVVPGNRATEIVKPFDINRSLLYYRVSTNDPYYRMPFLGRTIRDEEGIQLITDWINSLTSCN
jgi:uncharacterized repeat protein (TIGR03806 family)